MGTCDWTRAASFWDAWTGGRRERVTGNRRVASQARRDSGHDALVRPRAVRHPVDIRDQRPSLVTLLRRLPGAPTSSLRWTLLTFSGIALALGLWSAVTGKAVGLLIGLAACVVLILLALAAQSVAIRTGATERDAAREKEIEAEIAGWPRWKQIAFLLFGLVGGVTVILLGIWAKSWGAN